MSCPRNRRSWFRVSQAAAAALLASATVTPAAVTWDGEAGSSWWYNPVNWNANSNDNNTLPNTGTQANMATELNAGWDFLGDGVVFDPANDPSTGGPPAVPDPYPTAAFYLGNTGTNDNKFTVKSGTFNVATGGTNANIILSRNTTNRVGHMVQLGGNVLLTVTSGRLSVANAVGSTGIYEYHGGIFEANLGAAAGTNGVRLGGDNTSSGQGNAWFLVHNDGAAGRIKAANFLISSSAGGTTGTVEYHLGNQTTSGNFGVRPIQVVNNLSFRNSATQSARLNLALDEAPITTVGVPQNLGLFHLDDVTGNRTGATGSDPATQIFKDPTGTIDYSPGATVRSAFGTTYYDWTIQYNGEIIFSDVNTSQISSVVWNQNNNDVVLLGSGSVLGSQWNSQTSGNWSDGSKWSAAVPGGPDQIANFLSVPGGPVSVSVDSAVSAGHINFANANGYTVNGANALTVDVHGYGTAAINVTSGNHAITAPLNLANNTKVSVNSGNTLTVSDLQQSAVKLTKAAAGKLAVNNLRTTSVVIDGGSIEVMAQGDPTDSGSAAGVSVLHSVSATGGTLDLTNNKLITQSALGTWDGTQYTGVTGLVQTGRGDGSWNGATGIVTSETDATTSVLTTLAVITGAIRNGLGPTDTDVFAGQTINGNSTLVMYTWGGDANLDGTINGDDYFNIDSNILAQVPGYHNGDFDYNGEINGDDYFIIDANITFAQANPAFYTAAGGGGGLAAVPEPASIGLLGLGWLFARRSRRTGHQ
jgi:hypothetical protein